MGNINITSNFYHTGRKEGIVQVVQHLLPHLPYKNLATALWSLKDGCVKTEDIVEWVLAYCPVVWVYEEHINVSSPQETSINNKAQPGEVIGLVKQDIPSENGIYVYAGPSLPLLSRR